jgi:hypothetical protein
VSDHELTLLALRLISGSKDPWTLTDLEQRWLGVHDPTDIHTVKAKACESLARLIQDVRDGLSEARSDIYQR